MRFRIFAGLFVVEPVLYLMAGYARLLQKYFEGCTRAGDGRWYGATSEEDPRSMVPESCSEDTAVACCSYCWIYFHQPVGTRGSQDLSGSRITIPFHPNS